MFKRCHEKNIQISYIHFLDIPNSIIYKYDLDEMCIVKVNGEHYGLYGVVYLIKDEKFNFIDICSTYYARIHGYDIEQLVKELNQQILEQLQRLYEPGGKYFELAESNIEKLLS